VNNYQDDIYKFDSLAADFHYSLYARKNIDYITNKDILTWVKSIERFGSKIFIGEHKILPPKYNTLIKTHKAYITFTKISRKQVSIKSKLKALLKLYYNKKYNFVDKIKLYFLKDGEYHF